MRSPPLRSARPIELDVNVCGRQTIGAHSHNGISRFKRSATTPVAGRADCRSVCTSSGSRQRESRYETQRRGIIKTDTRDHGAQLRLAAAAHRYCTYRSWAAFIAPTKLPALTICAKPAIRIGASAAVAPENLIGLNSLAFPQRLLKQERHGELLDLLRNALVKPHVG